MRKPASDVAGIEEVNAKQDKIGYTPADDSKVVHSTDMRKPASDVAGIEEVSTLQTQVNNSAVGTNLLINTSGSATNKQTTLPGGTPSILGTYSRTDSYEQVTPPSSGEYFYRFTDPDIINNLWGLVAGETYTISGQAVINEGTLSFRAEANSFGDWYPFFDNNGIYELKATNSDGVTHSSFSYTFTVPFGAIGIFLSLEAVNYTKNTVFRFKKMKLEKGSVATDWCPNPSEILTKADDSKVAHLSGTNNFDTVPTVKNNPLLLASSLPSDLARTGQANTFNLTQTFSQGIKTLQTGSYADANSLVNEGLYFNTNLSIKNAAGSITGGFIQVLSGGVWERVRQFMYSDLANNLAYTRVSSDNGSTWSDWVQIITSDQIPTDLATKSDVTTAVSSATANMVDSTKATNFTAGLQSGGVDVATAADLKSVADKAWYQLDNKYIVPASGYTLGPTNTLLYKIDDSTHTLYLSGSIALTDDGASNVPVTVQLGSIIKSISTLSVPYFGYDGISPNWTFGYAHNNNSTNLTFFPLNGVLGIASNAGKTGGYAFVHYGELV